MLLTVSGFTQVKNQEATILFYNVAFGAITSGVGSCINKPKGTKMHKAFIRGFWQGSIGGLTRILSYRQTILFAFLNGLCNLLLLRDFLTQGSTNRNLFILIIKDVDGFELRIGLNGKLAIFAINFYCYILSLCVC